MTTICNFCLYYNNKLKSHMQGQEHLESRAIGFSMEHQYSDEVKDESRYIAKRDDKKLWQNESSKMSICL